MSVGGDKVFLSGDLETVTVVEPPGKDRYGDPFPGSGTSTDVPGCLFAPGPSKEDLVRANQTDTDGTVYAPPGTVITAQSRLIIRGLTYESAGDPRYWGAIPRGVEIPVRRVEG